MVVRFRIEISVPNDGGDRPHLGGGLSGRGLIMVAEDNPNFGPFQFSHAVGGSQDVVFRQKRGTAVELPIVDQPRHPGIMVNTSGTTTDNSVFVV